MLNSQDALLGPWLPGRDMLEDELRTFVGEYCRSAAPADDSSN
jgi:hypothetical protein